MVQRLGWPSNTSLRGNGHLAEKTQESFGNLCVGVLDQLDLVTFGGVDKGNDVSLAGLGRAIGELYAVGFDVLTKSVHAGNLEGKVDEVGLDLDRSGAGVIGDLDQFLAAGALEESELRPARGLGTANLFEAKDILVKVDCAVEVINTHAGVEEFGHNCLAHNIHNVPQRSFIINDVSSRRVDKNLTLGSLSCLPKTHYSMKTILSVCVFSLVAAPLAWGQFSDSSIAPTDKLTVSIEPEFTYQFDASFENQLGVITDQSEISTMTYEIPVSVTVPISRGQWMILSGSYEYRAYDFTRPLRDPADPSRGTLPDLWDNVEMPRFQALYNMIFSETFGAFVMGGLQGGWEKGAPSSEGWSYSLGAGLGWRPNEDLILLFGGMFVSGLEDDDDFLPFIGINWQVNDRFEIKTANGITATYQLTESGMHSIDAKAHYFSNEWRNDGGTAGNAPNATEETYIQAEIGYTLRPGEHYAIRAFAGMRFINEYTVRADGVDLLDVETDSQLLVGISGQLSF